MAAKKKDSTKAENIHVVVGTDEAQVKETALKLSRDLSPAGAGEFGLEVVDGNADNAEHAVAIVAQVVEAIQTIGFFGQGKVVWFKGCNFMADNQTGKAESVQKALDALVKVLEAGVPADVQFILSVSGVDKRRSAWLKLDKLAQVQVFDVPDTTRGGWEHDVESMVEERAAEHGLTFESGALSLFVLMAGAHTQQTLNELDKLDLYLGPERREVRKDDIRTMVPMTHSGAVFEIGDAIGKRDLRRALELMDRRLEVGDNAIGILMAAVIPKIRNFVLAQDIMERHRPSLTSYSSFAAVLNRLPESETAHLPKKKDGSGLNVYPLFLAAQECGKFKRSELRRALDECLKANHRLVTTSLDGRLVLSQMLTRMLVSEKAAAV